MQSCTLHLLHPFSPEDGANSSNASLHFTFNTIITDPVGTINCSLYVNNGDGFVVNAFNEGIQDGVESTFFNLTDPLLEGAREWYVNCTDTDDDYWNASSTFTVFIDLRSPFIGMGTVINKTNSTDDTPSVVFNVTDSEHD